MGWTDLFKSKSLKIKPDPTVRWFGKLPTYGDYYSSKADEDWVVEFNDWLIKGYQIYHSRKAADPGHGRLPLGGVVLRLPKSGMTVFGTVQDFGGDSRGRSFPLSFYVGVPTSMWPGPASDRIPAAMRVLNDLHALRKKVVSFVNSPGHFDTVFADREIILDDLEAAGDDRWTGAGRQIAFEDWFAAARDGVAAPDSAAWRRVSGTWGANIAQFESRTFEPTLRFPLAMKLPLEPQIAGWVRWLEGRMDIKRRFLSLLICGEPSAGPGRLSVVARDAVADDFVLLTPLAHTLSYVDDVCRIAPAADGDGATDEGSAAPVNWLDFVTPAKAAT
jgi:hypothetical protein